MANKQALLKALEADGWHLAPEALDEKPIDKISQSDLVKLLLNDDLKRIGKKFIPDGIMNGKSDSMEGPAVLQVVKVRNIAAPKDNETSQAAPPLYKVTLTDGVVNCNALVMEEIEDLNLNCAPGTKVVLLGAVKSKQSSLQLKGKSCKVLGGVVDYLYSKWKTAKDLSNHVRTGVTSEAGAPPPWQSFGARNQQNVPQVDTSKKTLQQSVDNPEDASSEFSQARQAALAEAMQDKLKINKTFMHQPVDKPQQAVAENESRPQQQALSSSQPQYSNGKRTGMGERKGRRGNNDDEDYGKSGSSKPLPTFTLFDVVKSKLQPKNASDDGNSSEKASSPAPPSETEPQQYESTKQAATPSTTSMNTNTNSNTRYNNYDRSRDFRDNTRGGPRTYSGNYRGPRRDYQNQDADIQNTQPQQQLQPQPQQQAHLNKPDNKKYLPPRLQRANDEKEQRYNNSGITRGGSRRREYNNYQGVTPGVKAAEAPAYDSEDFMYDLNANKISTNAKPKASETQTKTKNTEVTPTPTSAPAPAPQATEPMSQQPNEQPQPQPQQQQQQPAPQQQSQPQQQQQAYNNYDKNNNPRYNTKPNYNSNKKHYQNNNNNNPNYRYPNQKYMGGNNYLEYSPYYGQQAPNMPFFYPPVIQAGGKHPKGSYATAPPLIPIYYDQIPGANAAEPFSYYAPASAAAYEPYYAPPVAMPPMPMVPIGNSQPQQQQQSQTIAQPDAQENADGTVSDSNNNETKNSEQVQTTESTQPQQQYQTRHWKKGDQCMAKYIGDDKFYPAYIDSVNKVTSSCNITYIGYNESSEVKFTDLRPYKEKNYYRPNSNNNNGYPSQNSAPVRSQ